MSLLQPAYARRDECWRSSSDNSYPLPGLPPEAFATLPWNPNRPAERCHVSCAGESESLCESRLHRTWGREVHVETSKQMTCLLVYSYPCVLIVRYRPFFSTLL